MSYLEPGANPLLDLHKSLNGHQKLVEWMSDFDVYQRKMSSVFDAQISYSFAIPDEEALDTLTRLAPIVEIGAGSGYWAAMLRSRGVEISAYDEAPVGSGKENGFGVKRSWTDVSVGGPEKLVDYPDCTLFLCWPPYKEPMALDCLKHWKGKNLVVVGEDQGCTGCPDFARQISQEFNCVKKVFIPKWPGFHDYMSVYRRHDDLA